MERRDVNLVVFLEKASLDPVVVGRESIPFLVEIGERLPWYSRNSFLHGF